jgi:2-methylcitrate dehydratase PrpD
LNGTNGNTAIEALSSNVIETRFENFDQAVLNNARNRIIDIIGCLIAGVKASGNSELVELVKDWGGKEEATILVHGIKVPAHNAAMVNSIMARSFDFEALIPLIDGSIKNAAHISGTTIPSAIALGEMTGCNGKELLSALLVGDDAASRILGASGWGLTLGWDNTGTVNMFGAAAVAGRLLGLNKQQMKNAFGIVTNQLAGNMQCIWDGNTAFKLYQGLSARNAIFSVQLAKAGWTGPEDALLSRFGYYNMYTEGCVNPEILTKDLGKIYYSDSVFKPYSSCRGTHASIDCALAIVNKHEFNVEDIDEIFLHISPGAINSFIGQPFTVREFPHCDAAFSCLYTVACALLRKSVKPEHFSEESIRDSQIDALIKKIKLVELQGDLMTSAQLEISLKDGRKFSEFTDTPKGDPLKNPMSKDEIIAKFKANVEFSNTVTMNKAEKILELLENLEELDNINELVILLT